MNNILITGGAGFIGLNLSKQLVKDGYHVTILDNLKEQIHGKISESEICKAFNLSNFINGDIRSKDDWRNALKGQDAIIHLAAETGTGQSMYEIERYNQVNVLGTSYLLELLTNTKHNIKKMIIASSRAVYGEGKYECHKHGVYFPSNREIEDLERGIFNPLCNKCGDEMQAAPTDEETKIQPNSIYGITKYTQEQMMLLVGEILNIPTIALRYQNVYGPGQSLINPYTGILSIFSTRILNGNNIHIYEDGLESRDFVYIDDAVKATVLALKDQDLKREILNVGSGIPLSVCEVAKILKKKYNSNIKIIVKGNFRIGDIRHNYADLSKINSLLGYSPEYDFNRGVSLFIDWVNEQKIEADSYSKSIRELKDRGLIR